MDAQALQLMVKWWLGSEMQMSEFHYKSYPIKERG